MKHIKRTNRLVVLLSDTEHAHLLARIEAHPTYSTGAEYVRAMLTSTSGVTSAAQSVPVAGTSAAQSVPFVSKAIQNKAEREAKEAERLAKLSDAEDMRPRTEAEKEEKLNREINQRLAERRAELAANPPEPKVSRPYSEWPKAEQEAYEEQDRLETERFTALGFGQPD